MAEIVGVMLMGDEWFDGAGSPRLIVLVGASDRQWLEATASAPDARRLPGVRSLVPEGPDHPDRPLDALIAFDNGPLVGTPELAAVEALLETSGGRCAVVDLHLGPPALREAWRALRRKARPIYRHVPVAEMPLDLRRVDGGRLGAGPDRPAPRPARRRAH
jgi:hypothetical protein